ncbi:hypothetical protein [Thermosediminibacter litoriperuensis]|uniref:hypothetical protein n=1 Tax=Thermosediminibacter litoriperuensis TaxID=291989 RepID=UPI0014791F60|nr:hypothetical protein [Thermosediminibacter litoriperuensis]
MTVRTGYPGLVPGDNNKGNGNAEVFVSCSRWWAIYPPSGGYVQGVCKRHHI